MTPRAHRSDPPAAARRLLAGVLAALPLLCGAASPDDAIVDISVAFHLCTQTHPTLARQAAPGWSAFSERYARELRANRDPYLDKPH